MIYSAYKHTFSGATDEAVLTDSITVKTKVSSLTSGLLNVVSLARLFAAEIHPVLSNLRSCVCSGQLHSQIDRMCDTMFAFAIIFTTVLLWLTKMQNDRLESKKEDFLEFEAESKQDDANQKLQDQQDDAINTTTEVEAVYEEIVQLVQPQASVSPFP